MEIRSRGDWLGGSILFSIKGHNCSNKGHEISPNLRANSSPKSNNGDREREGHNISQNLGAHSSKYIKWDRGTIPSGPRIKGDKSYNRGGSCGA